MSNKEIILENNYIAHNKIQTLFIIIIKLIIFFLI